MWCNFLKNRGSFCPSLWFVFGGYYGCCCQHISTVILERHAAWKGSQKTSKNRYGEFSDTSVSNNSAELNVSSVTWWNNRTARVSVFLHPASCYMKILSTVCKICNRTLFLFVQIVNLRPKWCIMYCRLSHDSKEMLQVLIHLKESTVR